MSTPKRDVLGVGLLRSMITGPGSRSKKQLEPAPTGDLLAPAALSPAFDQNTAATPAPVYDSDALDALTAELGDDGPGIRTDLIETYLADSTSELQVLTAARDDASGEMLRNAAHALKSASAVLGLMALASIAADIEVALRTSPRDVDVASRATQLIHEYHRATAALRTVLEEGTETQGEPRDDPGDTAVGGHLWETPAVLLVDDDPVSQKLCVAHLTKMGYEVELAVNGSDALGALEQRNYAAVLMDCGMPVMDGYDTTRELRRRERNERHTPVIALTGANTIPDHVRCAAAGMDEYLTKPVNFHKLTGALQFWVHGMGVRTVSPPSVPGGAATREAITTPTG